MSREVAGRERETCLTPTESSTERYWLGGRVPGGCREREGDLFNADPAPERCWRGKKAGERRSLVLRRSVSREVLVGIVYPRRLGREGDLLNAVSSLERYWRGMKSQEGGERGTGSTQSRLQRVTGGNRVSQEVGERGRLV